MPTRRQMLAAAAAALVPGPAWAAAGASKHYQLKDIELDGNARVGRRMTLLVPKHTTERVPLLVALHGLGETHEERMGAYAWVERYGLGTSYDRLREPPVERVFPKIPYWDKVRLAEVNATLAKKPFKGLAIACPYTPNPKKSPDRKALFDEYAEHIVKRVIPRARREAKLIEDAAHTYLDGCSLGGYIGIEVFLRKPKHFGAWGTVQGALGAHRVPGYAKELAALIKDHGARPIHIETSTSDTFRDVNEQFARELKRLGVPYDFAMPPGPHNQPFLQDSGTLEMLLWFDRLPR
jgi:enterochelin esterase-like enzyme